MSRGTPARGLNQQHAVSQRESAAVGAGPNRARIVSMYSFSPPMLVSNARSTTRVCRGSPQRCTARPPSRRSASSAREEALNLRHRLEQQVHDRVRWNVRCGSTRPEKRRRSSGSGTSSAARINASAASSASRAPSPANSSHRCRSSTCPVSAQRFDPVIERACQTRDGACAWSSARCRRPGQARSQVTSAAPYPPPPSGRTRHRSRRRRRTLRRCRMR
jgi:hypothetical protein